MLRQLEVAEDCRWLLVGSSLSWLHLPGRVRLQCAVLGGSLHAAILPAEALLRLCVKHWQYEVFHDLGCKFRSDLIYRDFLARPDLTARRLSLSIRPSTATSISIRRNRRESHNVAVFAGRR